MSEKVKVKLQELIKKFEMTGKLYMIFMETVRSDGEYLYPYNFHDPIKLYEITEIRVYEFYGIIQFYLKNEQNGRIAYNFPQMGGLQEEHICNGDMLYSKFLPLAFTNNISSVKKIMKYCAKNMEQKFLERTYHNEEYNIYNYTKMVYDTYKKFIQCMVGASTRYDNMKTHNNKIKITWIKGNEWN